MHELTAVHDISAVPGARCARWWEGVMGISASGAGRSANENGAAAYTDSLFTTAMKLALTPSTGGLSYNKERVRSYRSSSGWVLLFSKSAAQLRPCTVLVLCSN